MKLNYDNISIKNRILIENGSIYIKEKSINVIRGENGCGKSLLVKNIANNNCNSKHSFGVLEQSNAVTLTNCSILQSIAMDDNVEHINKIKLKMDELKLDYLYRLQNKHLSGGEQRIINILRCVYSEADVLIMDEPTNDLDFDKVRLLIDILLIIKENKTIIIVSHDDRVFSIADKMFFVCDRKVKCKSKHEQESNLQFLQNELHGKNMRFISRRFHYNYINLVIVFLLGVIILMQVDEFKEAAGIKVCECSVKQNEIMLLSNYSDKLEYCDTNNILPIFAIQSLGSLNVIEYVDTVKKIKYLYSTPNIELYNIYLSPSDNYKLYPIEFFSKENKEIIDVLSYYKEKYYGEEKEVGIDTSAFFSMPENTYDEYDSMEILNEELYEKCIEELASDTSLIVSAAVVVLEQNYDETMFYKSDEVVELGKHMVFAYSKEVNELAYQVSLFRTVSKNLEIIFLMMMTLLVLSCITTKIIIYSNKNIFYLLRNYNYDIKDVTETLNNKLNNRVMLLMEVVVFLTVFSFYMSNLPLMQINFIFYLCFVMFCSIMYEIENLQIQKFIGRFYRWDSR